MYTGTRVAHLTMAREGLGSILTQDGILGALI